MAATSPMPHPSCRLAKPLFVNESNEERIDALLVEYDGRRSAFTITYGSLACAAKEFEEKMRKRGVPPRLWKGALLYLDPHCVPNSYRGDPQGTVAWLERTASSWRLVAVGVVWVTHRRYGYKAVYCAVEFPQDNAVASANATLPKGMSIGD